MLSGERDVLLLNHGMVHSECENARFSRGPLLLIQSMGMLLHALSVAGVELVRVLCAYGNRLGRVLTSVGGTCQCDS